MPDQPKEDTINTLLLEVRQLHRQLSGIKEELFHYKDLDILSVPGAVKNLVFHRKLLDEIEREYRKFQRNPTNPDKFYRRLEELLGRVQ